MPIVLFRVDERLIHGQVVVGWGATLHPDHIVVVDDELAASSWEQDLYLMGLPPDLGTSFEDVDTARGRLAERRAAPERTLVLTRDVATMLRLGERGALAGDEVNIGGIHHAPGRDGVLPYVFLDDEDRRQLRQLAAAGAHISARDLPTTRPVPLERLVGDGAHP